MKRIINAFRQHRANRRTQPPPAPSRVPQDTYASSQVPPSTSTPALMPALTPVTRPAPRPPSTLKGVARVQREFRDLFADKVGVEGYSNVQLVGDDIMQWSLELRLDEGMLAEQLKHARQQNHPGTLQLRIDFPRDYPRNPPFIWLQCPRLEYRTGFISHGAVCMEMLTSTGGVGGWQSTYTLESVLQTVRANFQVEQSRGIIHSWVPYTESEARAGLQRAKQQHKYAGYVG